MAGARVPLMKGDPEGGEYPYTLGVVFDFR